MSFESNYDAWKTNNDESLPHEEDVEVSKRICGNCNYQEDCYGEWDVDDNIPYCDSKMVGKWVKITMNAFIQDVTDEKTWDLASIKNLLRLEILSTRKFAKDYEINKQEIIDISEE